MINLGSFVATPNAADWTEVVEVLDDDTGTGWDLTGYLIEMEVRDREGRRRLYGSTTDGRLNIVTDGFAFSFPASVMADLRAGSYTANIRFTDSDGAVMEPVIANLPILEGGFR